MNLYCLLEWGFVHPCFCTAAQHMCKRAVTSSLCDHIDRQVRPGGLHAVSATLYLALHPHNLLLLCASLKASNARASTPKCCNHIIENHSVFSIGCDYLKECVYEDLCECVHFVLSQLWGIAFPDAEPILSRPLYLRIPPMSVPPPSLHQSPLMDLADIVGHAIATRGPS